MRASCKLKARVALAALVVTSVVSACGGQARVSSPTTQPPAPGNGPSWLLEDFDIAPLLHAGLSQDLLLRYFNTARTFLIIKPGHTRFDAMLPNATKVLSFASFSTFEGALGSGSVPSDVHYILYDNESWQATPANEQQQPISYAQQAENLAHQHGLRLIFTPAADLAPILSPSYSPATKYTGYLDLNLASQGARASDVFEIQAQQAEATPTFASFVSSAVGQARAANPQAMILLGLTTAAPKSQVTAQTLLDAYNSTRSEVSGYWINIPGGKGNGPTHPEIAVQFLQQLQPS